MESCTIYLVKVSGLMAAAYYNYLHSCMLFYKSYLLSLCSCNLQCKIISLFHMEILFYWLVLIMNDSMIERNEETV